jgi:hypothetical protein
LPTPPAPVSVTSRLAESIRRIAVDLLPAADEAGHFGGKVAEGAARWSWRVS